jgi:parallel beta-helix repeat protein
MRRKVTAFVVAVSLAAVSLQAASGSAAAASTIVVPDQYPTVQAAVNAASPGDTIRVRAGSFHEQVSIGKNLTIQGAGSLRTTILAPAVLVPDFLGRASIVNIHAGAIVTMTGLTVSGPGPTSCAVGSLNAGLRVIGGATLNLSSARVLHIHDSPKLDCNHNGTGIAIGALFTTETGHANIHDVVVADYQSGGISVFTAGSDAVITRTVVDAGIRGSEVVFTGGIEVGDGAVAKVTHDVISGNRCTNPSLNCGPDPMAEFQAAGINNGPGEPPGPGTEFADNLIVGNDIGIYLFGATDCCSVHDNLIVSSRYFGIAIQDGSNQVSGDTIIGGRVGVGVIADFADSVGTLNHERIANTSVADTQALDCCGVHATVTIH